MFCQNCGTQNEDNSMFCSNCGAPLQTPAQKTTVLQQNNEPFQPQVQYDAPIMGQAQTAKKKNKKKSVAVLVPIIIVLAVLIGVGSVIFSKLNSPLVKIGKGVKKIATSNEAYTYQISYDNNYSSFGLSGDVKIDLKGKNIEAVNIKGTGGLKDVTDVEAFLHTNDKEIGFKISEDEDYSLVFYNGHLMEYAEGELYDNYYVFEDFTDNEEKFTDSCFEVISLLFDVANGDKSVEDVQEQVIDILKDNIDDEYFDFDSIEIIKIDSKTEKQVTKELKKCLTDKKWLEENLGLSISKNGKETVYTFNIDIEKAVNALYDILKPLLKDVYNQVYDQMIKAAGDEAEYMDGYSFNDLVKEFMEEVEYTSEHTSIKIELGITKNRLSSVNAVIKEKYSGETYTTKVNVEISKADSFKSPNTSEYKKDINKKIERTPWEDEYDPWDDESTPWDDEYDPWDDEYDPWGEEYVF